MQALNFLENKNICPAQHDFIGYCILFYWKIKDKKYIFSLLRECFKLLSLKENNPKIRSNGRFKGRRFPEADMFFFFFFFFFED